MKCCFLRLQISDQPGKPFNRNLIANGQKYAPVLIDLFIEFVALVAHGNPLEPRTEATLIGCLMVSTAGMGICSPASTGNQKGPLLEIQKGPFTL